MSSSNLVAAFETAEAEDEKSTKNVNITKLSDTDTDTDLAVEDEKPPQQQEKKHRIMYTREELLEIKVLEASTQRPSVLDPEFYNAGVWEPDAWFKSDSSRSASPFIVDGKTVITEGKKIELMDVELAPKYNRDSFKEGCKVKPVSSEKPTIDKTRRLTGRAAVQRRHYETNYKDNDSISASSHEFDKLRKQDRETFGSSRDRFDSFNERKSSKHSQHWGENTPEWMSEPVVQGETFNFFNSRIEEEKKEYAANAAKSKKEKKRVRISPDVDKQEIKKLSRKSSREENVAPDGKKFDLSEFMKGVEYLPPDMFGQDNNGVRSKFTRFFQNEEMSKITRNSRPPSGTLIPDEVISDRSPVNPQVQQALFAPIQPAPSLINAAANAHAIQSSNISHIIEKRRQEHLLENIKQSKREVRGSLSVEELEGSTTVKPQPQAYQAAPEKETRPQDAFNLLLRSMKEAGQLPEKPSPVVSGLPGHLLPHPPTRTSPIFEKLKKTLSRSPSPKDFAKAVSTMASIISSHPTIDKELAVLKQSRIEGDSTSQTSARKLSRETTNSPKTPTQINSSSQSPAFSNKKSSLNPFTPTSVLKKMHNEKKEDTTKDNSILSHSVDEQQADEDEKKNLNSQFFDAATTPTRNAEEPSRFIPFHSAPVTPKNYFNTTATNTISVSAPGTPIHKRDNGPPTIKRMAVQPLGLHSQLESSFDKVKGDNILMAPSAFKAVTPPKNDLGAIGSGVRQQHTNQNNIMDRFSQLNMSSDDRGSPRLMFADPNLARGARPVNDDPRFQPNMQTAMPMPRPQSQQQQLLQAQRMAQIQQAQLLQQQKLQEIAKLGKQGNLSPQDNASTVHQGSLRHLLPEPDEATPRNPVPLQRPYQQQQHQQLLAYQQQQQLLQQQQQRHPIVPPPNQFPKQPRFPGHSGFPQPPPRVPGFQQFPHQPQPQHPVNPVNFAAQALVQQQLYNQAARARLLAQATLFQQQPQVMQAALMAQAALVRGQAQAQAAMMLNPRNLQAMAEQMGIRQPFNPNKQNRKQGSNASTPTSTSPDELASKSEGENSVVGGGGDILSKWFSNDVLKQSQQKPTDIRPNNSKILSVEELEKRQK